MSYFECDGCGTKEYTKENPFVEVRTPRPSDPSDLCCIVAGCLACFPGTRTPQEWSEYIETEDAYAQGYLFLT